MEKTKKRFICIGLMSLSLFLFSVSVSAYSGSFTFDIHTTVIGETKHVLASAQTSSTSSGETYAGGTISPTKYNYNVDITENVIFGKEYSSAALTANGLRRTDQYGTIAGSKYAVRVRSQGPNSHRLVGSGSINQ
ncbi:MAG: hypothetical protein RR576_05225 [Oscillospiraceae bacterium]